MWWRSAAPPGYANPCSTSSSTPGKCKGCTLCAKNCPAGASPAWCGRPTSSTPPSASSAGPVWTPAASAPFPSIEEGRKHGQENGQSEDQRYPGHRARGDHRPGGGPERRHQDPLSVLSQGHQRDRRLPHLCGGGEGGQEPGGLLRLPCERGDGGAHQHREGAPLPAAHPGADPLQPPDGLPHPAPGTPTASSGSWPPSWASTRCATPTTSSSPASRTPPPTWSGTTPSASSAAAAWPCAARPRKWGVIGCNDRGFATHIGCAFDRDLAEVDCVSCGQCIVACPTGALSEKDDTGKVWAAPQRPLQACGGRPRPPPSGSRWASASACPSAPTWRGRWSPPSAAWASTRCSTWTTPPISPSWRRGPSSWTGSRTAGPCP